MQELKQYGAVHPCSCLLQLMPASVEEEGNGKRFAATSFVFCFPAKKLHQG